MRRIIIAASTAALLALSGTAAFAVDLPGNGGKKAGEQCEDLKEEKKVNKNPGSTEECDYDL